MPTKIVDTGWCAVNTADVSMIYKSEILATPTVPATYNAMVMLRGIGNPQCPQMRFATAVERDAFYTDVVENM